MYNRKSSLYREYTPQEQPTTKTRRHTQVSQRKCTHVTVVHMNRMAPSMRKATDHKHLRHNTHTKKEPHSKIARNQIRKAMFTLSSRNTHQHHCNRRRRRRLSLSISVGYTISTLHTGTKTTAISAHNQSQLYFHTNQVTVHARACMRMCCAHATRWRALLLQRRSND